MPKMPLFYIKHHGVMDKALDCHAYFTFSKSYFLPQKLPLLKHILALPTWGQKRTQTELQPIEIGNFDLGHPV